MIKNLLKSILYKPYLLLCVYLVGNFMYFFAQNGLGETISTILLLLLNIAIIALIFKLLKNPLLRLLNRIAFFTRVPNSVLSGHLFIFTLFNPIPAIIIAILSKLFLRTQKNESYIDDYGNEVTQIKSLTPTIILSRKEQKTGEEEHIVMSKLKKKPKKVIYE